MPFKPPKGRIPVMAGPKLTRLVEFASPTRVSALISAPNVEVIRRHKDRAIVEIHLTHSDFRTRPRPIKMRDDAGRLRNCANSLMRVAARHRAGTTLEVQCLLSHH
jgi:hypothetical protein